MTVHRFPHAPISVVVSPGPPPHATPWDLELRGPLDAAALEHLLVELTAGDPDPTAWQHRLLRHGPDHHTLRFCAPQGAPTASVPGRVADRLTEPPPPADRPLTPAQRAALARGAGDRYEAVLVERETVPDAGTLREALRTVTAAHPQLHARLDHADGWRTAETRSGDDAGRGQDPLVEGEFTDEAGFAALLDAAGRTLDAYAGVQLRALLARDRRPAGPRADRLVVLAHELAVDAASWRVLLDDLTTALGTAALGTAALGTAALGAEAPAADTRGADAGRLPARARARRVPDGLADWVTELRELARDSAEAQHWSLVAELRSRAAGFSGPARTPGPHGAVTDAVTEAAASPDDGAGAGPVPGDVSGTVPVDAPDTGPGGRQAAADGTAAAVRGDGQAAADGRAAGVPGDGQAAADGPAAGVRGDVGPVAGVRGDGGPVAGVRGDGGRRQRRTAFTLDEHATERIAQGLARRLALTTGQVLTGVFALALARWQESGEVGFDVRSDPRAGRRSLRRHVGRLTDPYPVQLTVDTGRDLLGQLTALAGPLAACAGRAGGGAGFGACREWSPDPSLRRALRDLPPARACLTLDETGEPLPGAALPAPGRPTHPVEVRAGIAGGRLHIGIDWVTGHPDGVTDTSAATLEHLLRGLLKELADVPVAPVPLAFRATPQQSALYTGGDAQPGTGRHVEQLVWVWHGPLDTRRFTASWQSVFDCETVLRTAFTGGSEPLLVVHDRVAPEITRRVVRNGDWSPLLEQDRLRGFDLSRPGALRLTLLEPEQTPSARTAAPTRILVTYHRALLDTWSAHILLREFYRAYLAGGTLPGGERRPDLRDYTAWIAAQDPEPARGFWARSAPPDGAASRPGRSAGTTGLTGIGRARLRLDPVDTSRLARWAGTWGTAESSVLQAVWAMLIYWASGATGPAPVCFAVTVSGRGIPLDGAARLPGPLRNPLPMSVEVDPAGTVPRLLRQLRDRALDMAAYEWVPADWIRAWNRGGTDADTVIVFEDPPHPVDGLENELAAHGLHAEFPGTLPARSSLPIGLLAHHDTTGGLVLTGVHDRSLLDEDEAAELLAQSALLLRSLPLSAGESTTVGEALELLKGSVAARPAEAPPAGERTSGPLVTLREARRDRAGRICLIPPPDTPETCYDLLARTYSGPHELLVLAAGTDAEGARPALAAPGADTSLLLAGYSGAGVLACEIARRIAADGGRPPRVVLAGASADEYERARHLARALEDATAAGT
ncbi:condensation domain-containing protein [Streptomyces sp. DH24]|uniref:condensation domain-containing protein n=1 Tax=Streptomyces sp. DH24 TaxID=3040123 RepID=UPI0024420D15|nr:condensation domain-containing protein [Streptomyces sp. DH24]MDG9720161.1 condensation domain-containing protein [Streptomyces sp. DH24]